jgi:hypothetical protein
VLPGNTPVTPGNRKWVAVFYYNQQKYTKHLQHIVF